MDNQTELELQQALTKAQQMSEEGVDPDFVAKSLLSLNYRFNVWQKVVKATKLYLHSGQNTIEHSRLIKALNDAELLDKSEHEIHL